MSSQHTTEVDGYLSGQFDFATALATHSQALQDDAMNAALAVAKAEKFSGTFCTITVVGHSDRDDTPGLTQDQRRASELNASTKRAESARDWIFAQARQLLIDDGQPDPGTISGLTRSFFFTQPAGAAQLKKPNPASETDRQRNRRVAFLACFLN
ncbi:hypothetical protein [Streptomyces coeruleofuscus]|uniref:OmpA-like domain-containing protein n=1 Tax=Streptomyces coeruleofuscus TaxID=66879 RepID=A0ABP5WHT3_9ACTN